MTEFNLTIPKDLGDITLKQYQKYLKVYDSWDKEDEQYIKVKMLQIFCELSPEDVFKIPLASYDNIIAHIIDLLNTESKLVTKFTMTGKNSEGEDTSVEFGFIPKLDDMSFGEYIDLEKYYSDWDTMHKAMAVLFRPISHKKKEYYRIDNYEGTERYGDVMLDMPLNVALGSMGFFFAFRSKITNLYDGLFGGGIEEGGSSTSAQANFGRRWGWYQSIHTLAKGDVARIDEVTETNIHKCLMMLEYEKDKNNLESLLIKQSMRK